MQILQKAQYLRHEQYGLGVVTSSNAERTTIEFDLHGTKTFITSLMVVELLRGEAPANPAPPKPRKKQPLLPQQPSPKPPPGKAEPDSLGETHKTSAASVVMFDKDKKVRWKAP